MILPFKRPKIKIILDKHKRLLNNKLFKKILQLNYDLMEMFDEEKVNCKFYENGVCNHKKGVEDCFILDCPLR